MNVQRITAADRTWSVAQEGSGRPLLFVHGFPLDHSMWSEQFAGLARRACCIAPDLRGFGQSDDAEGTVTMSQFASDLNVLLDALGITEPVTFVGLSMGGYIGWEWILRNRQRVDRAILADTRAAADTAEIARGRELMAARVEQEGSLPIVDSMLPRLFADETHRQRPELVERTRQVMLRSSPRGIAAALRGMALRRDMTSELARMDLPILFLVGEHDMISPPDEMAGMAAQVPGAQFRVIPDAGHMAPLENGSAVNALIEEFL